VLSFRCLYLPHPYSVNGKPKSKVFYIILFNARLRQTSIQKKRLKFGLRSVNQWPITQTMKEKRKTVLTRISKTTDALLRKVSSVSGMNKLTLIDSACNKAYRTRKAK
jgi:hypothetical protein